MDSAEVFWVASDELEFRRRIYRWYDGHWRDKNGVARTSYLTDRNVFKPKGNGVSNGSSNNQGNTFTWAKVPIHYPENLPVDENLEGDENDINGDNKDDEDDKNDINGDNKGYKNDINGDKKDDEDDNEGDSKATAALTSEQYDV